MQQQNTPFKLVNKMEASLTQLRTEVKAVQQAVKELKELMESTKRSSFSLKEEGYEALLRSGIAIFFCENLTREVSDNDITGLIKKVLRTETQHRYKSDAARKYSKKMISVFKTEERRRILGITPCEQKALWSTERLARSNMDYMKAPEKSFTAYVKHLALIRKYIRDTPNPRQVKQFYPSFKKWINETFLNTIEWERIMEEDEKYDYSQSKASDTETIYSNRDDEEEEPNNSPLMYVSPDDSSQ